MSTIIPVLRIQYDRLYGYRKRPSIEEFSNPNNSIGFIYSSKLIEERNEFGIFVITPVQVSQYTKEHLNKFRNYKGELKTNFGIYCPSDRLMLIEDVIRYNNGNIKYEEVRTIKEYHNSLTSSTDKSP